jgi:putative transposase
MYLTHKVKIYPTKEQEEMLWDISDILRRVYNKCLDAKRQHYNLHKDKEKIPSLSKYDLVKKVNKLKRVKSLDWDLPYARTVEQIIHKLDADYQSFYALLKKWKKLPDHKKYKLKKGKEVPRNRPSLPRFKSWKYFTTIPYNRDGFKLLDKNIIFSLSKDHPLYEYNYEEKILSFDIDHYPISYDYEKIKEIQIYRDGSKRKDKKEDFYLSIVFEHNDFPEYKDNGLYQAIDLGESDIVVGVNLHSKFISIPNKLRENDIYWNNKIATVTRKISRCLGNKKGQRKSKRWIFLNKKRKRMMKKQSNQNRYYLHNLANKLLKNTRANTIIVGDLDLKQMAKKKKGTGKKWKNKANKTLNRRVLSGAMGLFVQFLTYKAQKIGKKIIKIDESYTTQMCCRCGNIKKGEKGKNRKMKKKDRTYICNKCGNHMGRDENSAINIMKRFLKLKENGKYDFLLQESSIAEETFRKEWVKITAKNRSDALYQNTRRNTVSTKKKTKKQQLIEKYI